MLRAALNLTQTEKEQGFEQLMALYLTEDSDKILALDAKITGANLPKALWQKIRIKLLDERNILMTKRAILFAQNQSVFIAVGAAHLARDGGFINRFKKAGYTFTRIQK